jgi:hypothetical protein
MSRSRPPTVSDRRRALRWLGAGSLAAHTLPLLGCGGADEAVPPFEERAMAAARPGGGGGGGGGTPPAGWTIGANVGVYDWAPSPFVDVVRSSRGFGDPDKYEENLALPRDANGWPAVASRLVVTAAADRPGGEWALGTWKGRFRGQGNLVANVAVNSAIQNVQRDGDVVTFDWVVTGTPTLILTWDGAIRDLKIVRPGFELDNHPLLHPDALNYYKRFHTLRFLDYMDQGFSEDQGEATWAQRQPAAKYHGRRSWEAMVEFFNACWSAPKSKVRAIWWNVPYRFAEGDCLAMGQRLQALLPAAALKFPEFSNELWNGASAGKWNHFLARANNPDDPDYALIDTPEPLAGGQYERLGRLWALQTARMARAMKTAFPASFGTTLFPVLAGQFHNLAWLEDFGLPWLALPAQSNVFGAPASYLGSIAAAPYLSGSRSQLDTTSTSRAMLAGLRSGFESSLAVTRTLLPAWRSLQQAYGIARLDAYEWQLSLDGSANAQVKLDTTLARGAGELVRDLAYALRDAGFKSLCFYAATPQQPLLSDINSFTWALNTSFGGEPTAKERAVRQLIQETGQ